MDDARFDALTRRLTTPLTRRAGIGLFAGLGLIHFAHEAAAAKRKREKKITICHKGKTIRIDRDRKQKHLGHGDTVGKCKPQPQPQPPRCGAGRDCAVFVTGATILGTVIGGLAAGDRFCQDAARAAGLSGTFTAWLSDATSSPSSRFTNRDSAGPYRLVANAADAGAPPPLVVGSFAELTDCDGDEDCLQVAIDRTETGDQLSERRVVWTGTKVDGTPDTTPDADNCAGWSSGGANGKLGFADGRIPIRSGAWTDVTPGGCTTAASLYCFEQA